MEDHSTASTQYRKILPSNVWFRLHDITSHNPKGPSYREVIKVDKRDFLEGRCVSSRRLCINLKMSYVSYKVLLFAQNFVVHIQLATQVGNVFLKNVLVWSKASIPDEKKQVYEQGHRTRCGGVGTSTWLIG